jgi:Na+/melibiose symporter-like transporter
MASFFSILLYILIFHFAFNIKKKWASGHEAEKHRQKPSKQPFLTQNRPFLALF